MSDHSLIEQGAALLAASGFGVIATKLIDLWAGGRKAKAAEPADFLRAAAEFQDKLSEGGGELLEEFRKEFRWLRKRTVELQGEVDNSRRDAVQAKADAAAARQDAAAAKAADARCQLELARLRQEFEALVQGRQPSPIVLLGSLDPKAGAPK